MRKIFVSGLAYDDGKSGISFYTDSVVAALAKENDVEVVVFKKDAATFASRNPNIKLKIVGNWLSKPALSAVFHLFVMPFTIDFSKYDFIFLPAGNRRLFCRYPKPTIATFHDLSQLHLAKKYDKLRMFYVFNVLRRFIMKVDKICAISSSTAEDIKKFYHIPDEKIFINYNGFDKAITEDKSVSLEQLKEKFGLGDKYLLYVARIEHPGKNHLNLIKAFEMLPAAVQGSFSLVFAGSDWNGSEQVHKYAASSPVRDKIKFCGFVDNKHLSALYRYAGLYVFPSFCEGFGLPMLEAMAAGVPVACSDRTSLPEIGAGAALTFNPDNCQDIADNITKILGDDALRNNLIEKGFERVKDFDWQKHAEKIVAEFEKLSKTKR